MKIKETKNKIKSALFSFNNEPFSIFSILLIVMLDIFILMAVYNGIDSERLKAPSPSIKYPYSCRMHFQKTIVKREWSVELGKSIKNEDTFPFKKYESLQPIRENRELSPVCRDLREKVDKIINTQQFKLNLKTKRRMELKKATLVSKINQVEKRYNTKLFEKHANEYFPPDLKLQKSKYYDLIKERDQADKRLENILKLNAYNGYKEYVNFVETHRDAFHKEVEKYEFWQVLIAYLYLLKFTVPLLLIFLLAYRFASRPGQKQSTFIKMIKLLSTHIIVMVAIPIFFGLMNLIYHIIPHRFLQNVIDFLYKFGVMFLGYYFLIAVGILVTGVAIYYIQKSVAAREAKRRKIKEKELYISAYNTKTCPRCKNAVNYDKSYCGVCGEVLNRDCDSCGNSTPKNLKFCTHCGKEKKEKADVNI